MNKTYFKKCAYGKARLVIFYRENYCDKACFCQDGKPNREKRTERESLCMNEREEFLSFILKFYLHVATQVSRITLLMQSLLDIKWG